MITEIRNDRPIPNHGSNQKKSPLRAALAALKPGESGIVEAAQDRLLTVAKRMGVRITTRKLHEHGQYTGKLMVWRLDD